MNDLAFKTAYDRLVDFYKQYGDNPNAVDSLKMLADIVKERDNAQMLITFKENPYAEKLLKMVIERYKNACERQMNLSIKTEAQQRADTMDKDWALFFVGVLGGNATDVLEKQTEELEVWVKKVGA